MEQIMWEILHVFSPQVILRCELSYSTLQFYDLLLAYIPHKHSPI